MDNILALLREMDFRLFAVIQKGPIGTFKSRRYLQRPFQFFLERINEYTRRTNPELLATLIYDSIEDKANRVISESVTNFLYRHGLGKEFEHVMDFPTFGDSKTTPGLQIADLVAYCVNSRFAGRRGRLERIYQQISKMTED